MYNLNFKTRRMKAGLTQEQLAQKSGVSVNVVKAFDKGVRATEHAQINTLVALCNALECSISDLLNEPEMVEQTRKCEARRIA